MAVPDAEEPLVGPYTFRVLEDAEFEPLFREHHAQVFARRFDFDLGQALSPEEKAAIRALGERIGTPYRLNLGVYRDGEFVGWSFGLQQTAERFYMINAGVLPAHRGRGIYSALVRRVLDRVEREGFQVAFSRHAATNNAILVPKLKAGFVITGFEISDQFGSLVHLSYFFNQLRRRVLDVRSGETLPNAELKRYLRLDLPDEPGESTGRMDA